jgi:hypothetical protein
MDVYAELERIDRELALERRERIVEKTSDDATMVDMRPISQLIEAIDSIGKLDKNVQVGVIDTGKSGKKPQDDTTAQTPREVLANNPGGASLHDTIPEPQGRKLAQKLAEMNKQSGVTQPATNPRKSSEATRGGAARKSSDAGKGDARKRPDAPLSRDSITVNAKPVSDEYEVVAAKKTRAGNAWVVWVIVGLVVAGGVTAAVLAM